MTETRAPFNGKKKKPAGVFIRLHDGMLNEMQISVLCNPKRSSTENILAIGMPVAGSEMGYEATVAHYEAKLAERDAEITRLNQKIIKLKDIIAGAMIQSCLHGADGDIGRLRRVEAELEAINTLNSSEGMIRENCP